MLRGSRDFASVADYKKFLRLLLVRLNAGCRDRLKVEVPYLKALPKTRLESAKRVKVKVDSGSVIYVNRNVYSVHSRLIGEPVEARFERGDPGGLVRRPNGGAVATIARTRQASRRLPAHHRLAGTEAWRFR